MTKKQFMIYIEESVMEKFKEIKGRGNISGEIQAFLENSVTIAKKDSTDINIKLLKTEIDDLAEKHSKITNDLITKRKILTDLEQEKEKKQIKELEKQKETLEKAKCCSNCGNIIQNKAYDTKIGTVCQNCYYAYGKDKAKEWF